MRLHSRISKYGFISGLSNQVPPGQPSPGCHELLFPAAKICTELWSDSGLPDDQIQNRSKTGSNKHTATAEIDIFFKHITDSIYEYLLVDESRNRRFQDFSLLGSGLAPALALHDLMEGDAKRGLECLS